MFERLVGNEEFTIVFFLVGVDCKGCTVNISDLESDVIGTATIARTVVSVTMMDTR